MIVYLPGFTVIQSQAAVWLALGFKVGFDCIAVSDNDDKDRVDPVVFLC